MQFLRNLSATKMTGTKKCVGLTAAALMLTCMPLSTASANGSVMSNFTDRTQEQQSSSTPGRTVRVVVDGKEVRGDGVAAQSPTGQRDTNVKWTDDRGGGTINAKDIELTDDERDVKSIARNGYLVIDETRDGVARHIRIEPGKDGKLKRSYTVKGAAREFDEEGREWLARILREFVKSSR